MFRLIHRRMLSALLILCQRIWCILEVKILWKRLMFYDKHVCILESILVMKTNTSPTKHGISRSLNIPIRSVASSILNYISSDKVFVTCVYSSKWKMTSQLSQRVMVTTVTNIWYLYFVTLCLSSTSWLLCEIQNYDFWVFCTLSQKNGTYRLHGDVNTSHFPRYVMTVWTVIVAFGSQRFHILVTFGYKNVGGFLSSNYVVVFRKLLSGDHNSILNWILSATICDKRQWFVRTCETISLLSFLKIGNSRLNFIIFFFCGN